MNQISTINEKLWAIWFVLLDSTLTSASLNTSRSVQVPRYYIIFVQLLRSCGLGVGFVCYWYIAPTELFYLLFLWYINILLLRSFFICENASIFGLIYWILRYALDDNEAKLEWVETVPIFFDRTVTHRPTDTSLNGRQKLISSLRLRTVNLDVLTGFHATLWMTSCSFCWNLQWFFYFFRF